MQAWKRLTLTARERGLVQLMAEGKSSKAAAEIFGINVNTVETHRGSVIRKLKLGSIVDLVRHVVRNGIVSAQARDAPLARPGLPPAQEIPSTPSTQSSSFVLVLIQL